MVTLEGNNHQSPKANAGTLNPLVSNAYSFGYAEFVWIIILFILLTILSFVVASRRSDLEILGYVMLQWLCSRLPWENNLDNKEYVKSEKIR